MRKIPTSLLVVDDDDLFVQTLRSLLELEGYHVTTASDGLQALSMLETLPFDLILLDIEMPKLSGVDVLKVVKGQYPDTEVIMLSGVNEIKIAVDCIRSGAYYYLPKPYTADELLLMIERALERKQLLNTNKAFKTELQHRAFSSKIVTNDSKFLDVLKLAERVAPSDAPVLIQGESGTGKELVANFVHNNSARSDQALMALNCSSIPENLMESELFGHEKGAFTDASSAKQGLVEIARGGTLFLDEIGEMSHTLQPKLLRFLQTGEFRRVGGNKNLKSDVRIISATNADLQRAVAAKTFREDLLYRINVVALEVPPLRDRKDDIPVLVQHILGRLSGAKEPKRIESEAIEFLMKYDWPGNVRELENVIQRAHLLCEGSVIGTNDLAIPIGHKSFEQLKEEGSGSRVYAGSAMSIEDLQRAHIEGVLKSVKWNKDVAAKILGVSVRTLYAKMQGYHMKEPK